MVIAASVLICIGALVSLLNWGTLFVSRSDRHVSPVPLIGALLLGVGLALLPRTRPYAALSILADFGTLVLFLAFPQFLLEIWSTSGINLVHSFRSETAGRRLDIKLFRRRIAVIHAEFDPPAPSSDIGALVASFGMMGKWLSTTSGFLIEGYAADRQLLVSNEGVSQELNYPSEAKYPYDSLNGLVLNKLK